MNNKRNRSRGLRGFLLLSMTVSLVLASGSFVAVAAGDDLVIIANPGLIENAIGQKDLQRIFLGKKTRWDDESSIVPVMLKSGPLHDRFIEGYLDRSVQRFVTYWRQMVFTGKGVPPRNFVSETDLVDFVAATPGSVGYVSAETRVPGVKILSVD